MKTIFAAIGAVALASTPAFAGGDGAAIQSEIYAVQRGDYAARTVREAINDATPTLLSREAWTEEARPVRRETPLNPQFTGPRSR